MKSMLLATAAACALVSCGVTDPPKITGVQSFQIDLVAPTDPGSETTRLGSDQRNAVVNITALDDQGNVDTSYNNTLQVYVQYLGTLTPYLCFDTAGCAPLATVPVVNGKATNVAITLPAVFGPTELWFDDGTDTTPSYASGTSTTIWYRDPFIADIQTPANEDALDALESSPLDDKNVPVAGSRYGSDGRLVVTSVFQQGYTVADVKCGPGGAPPCVGSNYDTVEVFSFSEPEDELGSIVQEGEVITSFTGGVAQFDGLTEVGFPQTFTDTTPVVNTAMEPASWVLDPTWFDAQPGATQYINFQRAEAAALEVDGAIVCPLDSDYTTYKQWKLAPPPALDCTNYKTQINVITEGVLNFDPGTCVGKTMPRVTGMLRPVNIGSFNVWLIYPRAPKDLQFPSGDATCFLPAS